MSTIRENFTGFWKTWRCELAKREYALLDELLPGRVKSVKEWMVETGYAGAYKPVLKDVRDRASGQTAVWWGVNCLAFFYKKRFNFISCLLRYVEMRRIPNWAHCTHNRMPFQCQSFCGHLVVLPLSDLRSDKFLFGAFQCHEGVHWIDGSPYHTFLDNAARAVELADSTAGIVTRSTPSHWSQPERPLQHQLQSLLCRVGMLVEL